MAEAKLRIGLEAGEIYVGHAGGGGRFVYSIVGDTANTASRVEGLNKHLKTQVLATGDVVEGFDDILTRYLGAFQFVGKRGGIPVYEVVAMRASAKPEQLALCEAFGEAQRRCEAGDWQAAAELFDRLLESFPDDGPAQFLRARCSKALESPDAVDDPMVIRMDAK
jgi:adenylate cyclase